MIEKFKWWIFTYVDGLIIDDRSAKSNAFFQMLMMTVLKEGVCAGPRDGKY